MDEDLEQLSRDQLLESIKAMWSLLPETIAPADAREPVKRRIETQNLADGITTGSRTISAFGLRKHLAVRRAAALESHLDYAYTFRYIWKRENE